VEALTRNAEKAAALRSLGLTKVVVADLATSGWHGQLEPGADFVVNCVSSAGGPDGYRQSYVAGMKSVLGWAARGPQPAGTVVYTSSTSVYPQGGGATVEETAPADGATPNGRIIRESEKLLEDASAAACRRWFILRLAGIYGPDRHHLLNQLREGAASLGGSGSHRLNLAHRDDIVAALLACLSAPVAVKNEIFNVVDSAPAPREEVVRWLAGRLGKAVPAFDGVAGSRRGGEPMPDRIISSAKIQRMLGWRPVFPDYRSGYENLLSR
jgi:nucleoside-diphosphate-sugar epimerase